MKNSTAIEAIARDYSWIRGNLQVVDLPPEDSFWMKQTVTNVAVSVEAPKAHKNIARVFYLPNNLYNYIIQRFD